jgi:hypothetical protein
MKFAVLAAEKALGVYMICLGKDGEETEKAEKSVRAFKKQLPAEKWRKCGALVDKINMRIKTGEFLGFQTILVICTWVSCVETIGLWLVRIVW